MCAENNQLKDLCKADIIKAAETMVDLEYKYIDKMFEMGDIEGIKSNDLKHFIKKGTNEKLTDEEKNLVGNILLGFAQTECDVSDYWTQKVVSWFPKHEIQQMAMMFGSQETIHAVAYSYLNETLGLENFEAFLHEEATANRFDNLVGYNGNDPRGIARSLAVFSALQRSFS